MKPGKINHRSRFDPIRVVVNAGPLRNIATGIGRYIKELYTHIQRLHPEIEIRYFDGARLCSHMPKPARAGGAWTAAVDVAWRLPPGFVYMARVFAHKIIARRFYGLCRGFDIYHEAGYFPYKTPSNVKTVFTVHDLSLKMLPRFHPKDRVLFYNRYFEKSLARADAIVTPSYFTAKEITRTYTDLDAEIHPVYLGCDKDLFRTYPEEKIEAFKQQMRLPDKYALFAGTSDPRKNIQTIVDCLDYLPESVKLVCTGWSGWGQGMQKNSSLNERIFFTGYVPDIELALLYAGARVFVYPSFYEGFGLPVLEAMACGCPVVCANAASLPEVAGEAAIYCSPDDAKCLANSIAKVLDSKELHAFMRLKGFDQSAKFDWSATAEKTVGVFERVRKIQ